MAAAMTLLLRPEMVVRRLLLLLLHHPGLMGDGAAVAAVKSAPAEVKSTAAASAISQCGRDADSRWCAEDR
ncbi:MAG: hypothetical protein WKF84_26505 [Pyrinomonadaceae bacterium]